MQFEVKMKTGFYKTTNYDLSADQHLLLLIPVKNKTDVAIQIPEEDLISIILTKKKKSEIEIKTYNQIFTGTFTLNTDLREVQQALKKHITTKIHYEEE